MLLPLAPEIEPDRVNVAIRRRTASSLNLVVGSVFQQGHVPT